MIRSMTAYGRAEKETPRGKWAVELHSVNRKGLEVNLLLPKDLLVLDLEVRKWLSAEIQRGQLTVRIVHTPSEKKEEAVGRLKALKETWEEIAKTLQLDPYKEISLPFLISQLEDRELSLEEALERPVIQEVVHQALAAFVKMREVEGKALLEILEKRLSTIRQVLEGIQQESLQLASYYRQKLLERLKLLDVGDVERIEKEIVFHVDRADISEEIERLISHVDQFTVLLRSSEKAIGRTLDFLTQEMGREITTLNAKTGGHQIAKSAVIIKSEIEKIREQVQNIE